MANPKEYGLPDTYKGRNWYVTDGCNPNTNNDQCGVHTNMGVMSHWFYLLSVGGNGVNDNGQPYSVSGIGINKASSIAYATELVLSATADYEQCMEASIMTAKGIFGDCSAEAEMTARAWYACGLGSVPISCKPTISFCSPSVTYEQQRAYSCNDTALFRLPVSIEGSDSLFGGIATVNVSDSVSYSTYIDFDLVTHAISFNKNSDTQYVLLRATTHGCFTGTKIERLKLSLNNTQTNASLSDLNYIDVVVSCKNQNTDTGGVSLVDVGRPKAGLFFGSPFAAKFRTAKNQIVYTAEELRLAGVRPGTPISRLGFRVIGKHSSMPYENFKLTICFADSLVMTNGWLPSTLPWITAFSNTLSTDTGINLIAMNSGIRWDGASDLALQTCFTDTSLAAENDILEGYSYGAGQNAFSNSVYNLGDGCSLTFVPNNVSTFKPVLYVEQIIPSARVAHSGSSDPKNLISGALTDFWVGDSLIVCSLVDSAHEVSCLTVGISSYCNDPFTNTGNRNSACQKSFQLNFPESTENLNGILAKFFYSDSEVSGLNLNNLFLVETEANNAAEMNTGNTVALPVSLEKEGALRYVSAPVFHFKNIFLTNTDPFGSLKKNTFIVKNPFKTDVDISYAISDNQLLLVELYDIIGKKLMERIIKINNGIGTVKLNDLDNLPTGNYVLTIRVNFELYTFKLLKA